MTKHLKKRLTKAFAMFLAVAMLVGTLPVDMLGGIASVKAAQTVVEYNFGELETAISEGQTGTFKDIAVDATNNGKLSPHNGGGCCAQFNAGTILSVPVSGPCTIAVTGHDGNGNYCNFTINGTAVDTSAAAPSLEYTGEAGTVEIVSTATSYIKTITLTYPESGDAGDSGDDASGNDASDGDTTGGESGGSETGGESGGGSESEEPSGDASGNDASSGDSESGDESEDDEEVDDNGIKTVTETYTNIYSFLDESIVTSAMDGKTPAVSVDGKLTVASSASSTFKRNGGQHGVQMANGGTATIAVDGACKIIVGGCQYNKDANTIELNGEVVQTGTKTGGCPEYTDLSAATLTSEANLANCFVLDYTGEAGDVVLTFNGTNYVPYIIVTGTITKKVMEKEYTNIYNFLDESIVTSAMDGKTPAVSVDGKLTVASSASSTFKRNGAQHGVQMANGGTATIAVDGACKIIVGGCQYNKDANTIELNGEVVQTGTKTGGCPEYTDLSAATLTSEANLANCFVLDYTGEAGDVVLTFNGTNYVPYIIVTGTEEIEVEEYTSVYNFLDESIVTSAMDGKTPAVSADGKLTVASGASSTFKRNGAQHGVQMANGGTATIAVEGNSTIIVGGCQYNKDANTIELNGEVVQTGTKTGGCPEYTDLSVATLTSEANLANCFVFNYEGEAGEVVLTFNGTNYVPYIIVSGIREVAGTVEATVTLTGTDLLQEGDQVTLTNAADKSDVVDVTEGGTFALQGGSIYNVAVNNSDIAASIGGREQVATADVALSFTIDLVATVVHPVVTINDPADVLGDGVITLTNMADGTDVVTVSDGNAVKLSIGASYLVTSSVAAATATIDGGKTITVSDTLEAITIDIEETDMTHHVVDVWDFGVEELADTELMDYNNNLTPALVLKWYEGLTNASTGEAYKAGDVVPQNVLGYDKDGKARRLDAGDGLYLTGEQSKANKWRHRGLKTLSSIPNEMCESEIVDEYGVQYQGIMYNNAQTTKGEKPYTWMELEVTEGDIVWAVVASNGTSSDVTWESPSGDTQTFTFTRASRTKVQNTCKFYAAETGTYKFYSANEKLVVARIYRETPTVVTVSGSVTGPEGKDLNGGKLVFTNLTTGAKKEATIAEGKYSVDLCEQYTYSLKLENVSADGNTGYIVGENNSIKLKNEDGDTAFDVEIIAVDLATVTGSLADLTAEAAAELEMTFVIPAGKVFEPVFTLDKGQNTFTLVLEQNVEYAITNVLGVDDYTLKTESVSASADGTLNIVFEKKPVYDINITLDGVTAEEAAKAVFTFSRLLENDGAVDGTLDGYVYTFTGTEGIELRDGQYKVAVALDGYTQKVTADVKVKGAAVKKTVVMNSNSAADATVEYKETITVGATGCDYTTINAALDAVRHMERTEEQRVTISIQPGDYQEMLVVDVDNVTLKNASENASIMTKDKGVNINEDSVRITSYYGHGYTYYSQGADCKYDADLLAVNKENGYPSYANPGSGTTDGSYWNATVVVVANGFTAEGIIFENAFNQYVSTLAADDVIVPQGGAKGEANGARNSLEVGDTRIQNKAYVERAAALAIGNGYEEIFFDHCSFIGRQDTLYGGKSTVAFYDCDVYGGTDYIFGGMIAVFAKCDLVLNTDGATGTDVAYITAAQQLSGRGYLMYNCNVVGVTPGVNSAAEKVAQPGYFGRPWEATTSEATFIYTVVGTANDGTSLIAPAGWNDGLGGKAKAYEYGTYELTPNTDNTAKRVTWSNVLSDLVLPDGTIITIPKYLGSWKAFEGKDMTIVLPDGTTIAEPTDPADEEILNPPSEESETTLFTLDSTADLAAFAQGDKADAASEKAGTEDYFEIIYSAKSKVDTSNKTWEDGYSASQRINFGGAMKAASAGGYMNAIKFTTSNPATVKVWWVANTNANDRQIAIYNEAGATVATTDGTWTKNSAYIHELALEDAGTYYLGCTGNTNYIFKLEIQEEKTAEPIVSELDSTAGLTAFAQGDKADGASEKAGTEDYFEIIYSAKSKVDTSNKTWEDGYSASQRINFGGAMKAASTGGFMNAIKFTTTYPATVKVWWVANTNANDRQIAIYNEAGATVATTDGTWTKNSAYIHELALEDAGTYYLGCTGNTNYIFKVLVTETPAGAEVKPPRADWSTVAAPEITNIALHVEDGKTDESKIDVTVKGFVEYDGADRLEVDMLDVSGNVITTVGSTKLNTAEDPTTTVSFVPEESGAYSFVAHLMRMDSTDEEGNTVTYENKVSAVSNAFAFSLPLTTPAITSVTNKGLVDGKGTLEIAWAPVKEAVSYLVTVTQDVSGGDVSGSDAKIVREVETTELITLIDGLQANNTAVISIVACRNEDKSEAGTLQVTVKDVAERTWSFSAYGSSTSLDSNMADSSYKNNGFFKDYTNNTIRVWSNDGKGKVVPGSTDGLAYYYTAIDPSENFTLTADIKVNGWKLSNGQEGFGLMVSDTVGESGNATAFWNNSYQLFATKIEYNWDTTKGQVTTATSGTNGIVKHSGKLGLGWIAKTGTTATDVAKITAGEISMSDNFKTSNGTLETSAATLNPAGGAFNIVGNASGAVGTIKEITEFKLEIQRNNDGYVLRYLDSDGDVINEKLFYDDNRNTMTQIDKKNIYVGFVASRNADITVTNYELTTIDPEEDAPATEKPVTYDVDPSYQILSSVTSNSDEYTMVFYGNADGKLTILNDAGEVVVQDAAITAKKKYSVIANVHEGDNKFEWAFVPNADYMVGEYQGLSSYEMKEESFHVYYDSFDGEVIYVAPNGTAKTVDNEVGSDSATPTDIYSAVAYAQPGQKIYLAGGKYELNNVLIDRNHDGTAEAPIYLMADPAATERPVLDFAKQTGNTSAMILAGNYWYLKGFDVTNSMNAQKGLQVSGSYNVVEDVDAYYNGNTGIQISRYLGSDKYDQWPSYNTILNCTSYLNADAGYEDADGFAAKLTVADGNKFVGCIAAYNADDGWDLFAKVESGSIGAVTLDSCLAFKNGYMLGDNKGNTDASDDVIDPYMTGAKEFSAGNGNGFKMGGDSMSGHHVIKNSIAFANKAKGIDSNSCPDIEVYNCTSFDNESYNVALYTNTAVNTAYIAQGVLSVKSTGGVAEQLKLLGTQSKANVYGANNYYFDGTVSKNADGAVASVDWFVNTDTKAAMNGGITRNADGSINMNGYLELKADAPANTGARLGSTSVEDVIEVTPEISLFAANVKTLADIDLSSIAYVEVSGGDVEVKNAALKKLVDAGYDWKYPKTATAVFSGTTTEFVVSAAGKEDKTVIVNLVEFTGAHLVARENKQGLYGDDMITLLAVPVFEPQVSVIGLEGFEEYFSATIAENDKLGLDVGVASFAGEALAEVRRKADSKDGIAKFTATITAKLGGKTVKKTASYQFTVKAEEAYINYTIQNVNAITDVSGNDVSGNDMINVSTATINKGESYRFSVLEAVGLSKKDVKIAVNDKKVLKLDSKKKTFTAVGEGTATITLTAAADKKVIAKIAVTVKGSALKVNMSTITVDRALKAGTQFTAIACYGEELEKGSVVVKSAMKGKTDYASYLTVDRVAGNSIYTISAIEKNTVDASTGDILKLDRMPTGTYQLTLGATLASGEEVEYTVPLKITETKPTVSVKQTKKVNLFYTAGTANNTGALTASSKLAAVTLKQDTSVKSDYKLTSNGSGYDIVVRSTANTNDTKGKKIVATASFYGYKDSYNKTVNINVSTIKKAPKLKLEVDNKVLYTKLGMESTAIRILDTTTNTYVTSAIVELTNASANKNFTLEDNILTATAGKSGTVKISVWDDTDWATPVVLSQSISVNKSAPKATIAKLALNSEYAGAEQAASVITVKNALDFEVATVSGCDLVVGANAKANKIAEYLNWDIEVNEEGQNVLTVSMDVSGNDAVAKGSYSFKANIELRSEDGENVVKLNPVTVALTVTNKVTLTTKQSGSIDLANRTGSSVSIKPTMKNLNGTIVGVELDDDASNQFNVVWDSVKGAAVVTAKEGIDLKKGGKYKVTPTFIVELEGDTVEVAASKVVTIVPKQSTLKTTKLTTLETSLSAPSVAAKTTLKSTSPAKAEILDVIQTNYLENFAVAYDNESDTVSVKIIDAAGLQAGKTYKIKLYLEVEGSSVTTKAQSVTVSVKVVK